jgi:diguanylate cyclase (GGDEF)-like protein
VPGISQLPVHGSTMHDDGENAMEKQWTEQDLHSFVQTAQVVFDGVSLTEEQPEPGWQDESLQVDYELRGGRVDCVLRRIVEADGKRWKLQMSAPLAGNVLPEERMTPRERELCRDDMSHDFLTGVYNRQYLERVFGAKLEQWARQGRSAAVALVALDKGPQLCDTYGQPVMDQLHCFVGNQWKKSFDTPAARIVCRLTGSIFVVGSLDADAKQLADEMRLLYEQMPHACITTVGMMHRVPFTLSCGVAGLEDVQAKNWQTLYEKCDERLRAAQAIGGDCIREH